jgi:hypothetical protein
MKRSAAALRDIILGIDFMLFSCVDEIGSGS